MLMCVRVREEEEDRKKFSHFFSLQLVDVEVKVELMFNRTELKIVQRLYRPVLFFLFLYSFLF